MVTELKKYSNYIYYSIFSERLRIVLRSKRHRDTFAAFEHINKINGYCHERGNSIKVVYRQHSSYNMEFVRKDTRIL